MKKKIICAVILLLVVSVIASCAIYKTVQKKQQEKMYNDAFTELFVNERNGVFSLYEAIGITIENPTEENYNKALNTAIKTEKICGETFGKICNMVPTYGAELVYYATFYRDVKATLSSKGDLEELNGIYELLGKITALYDSYSNSENISDNSKKISEFYKSLSLLNEEMK